MSSRPQADSATPMAVRLPLHAESAGAPGKIVPPHLIYPLIHVIVTRRDDSSAQKVCHWTRLGRTGPVPRRLTVEPAACAAFIRAQHPHKPAEHWRR
jgi:hypothetical protein